MDGADLRAAMNPRLRVFSARNVLGLGVGVFARNLVPFLILTVALYTPLFVLAGLAIGQGSELVAEATLLAWLLTTAAIGMLFSNIAAAAVMYATVAELRGHHASLWESLRVGLSRIPAVLGVALLTGLLLATGIYYYIAPGLMVAAIMWVAVPAAVIERTGVLASIKRSDRLTNGSRWPIVSMVLVVWLVDFGLHLALSLAFRDAVTTSGGLVAFTFGQLAISVLTTAFSATITAVGYYTLRIVKEHVAVDDLAQVFD